tara:strand:+ start:875 stop:1129 length:255 start_codon:yes stop_codon:yes gene_type:complete
MSKEKIYTYTTRETSEDTRTFTIKSDKKLTYEEVTDIYQDGDMDNEGKEEAYSKGISIRFDGTEYGDSESDIDGDFIEEEDNEK